MNTPILYRLLRPLIKCFVKIVYRPIIEGSEFIPLNDGIILAGNHTNILDPILLISSTKRCIRFLAKDSLSKGFKGILFNSMGIIPVDRETHNNDESIKKTESILKSNGVVCIFPEGTINRTNDTIMPFKKGVVRFAENTSKMILPFTITGKYGLFKKVKLKFYEPIKIEGDIDKENQKLMNIIKTKLEENSGIN